ncbi:MAG: terpene cyclase/mutase family protein [Candidatus Aminicenantes bacterium]|nr:terpene cyclase/mutase family protein [Candidatus Aminicenantes bacterium]
MKQQINRAIEFLLARGNLPILFWLKKDILEISYDREQKNLRKYAHRVRLFETQRPDGSWCERVLEKSGIHSRAWIIIDTLKNLFYLYDYGCTLKDEGVVKAINFLFSIQTKEGDFRGAFFNEYVPTFHALALEILCRFGLEKDKRVQRGFRWLIEHRQKDGGWVIPYQIINNRRNEKPFRWPTPTATEPIPFDLSLPSSARTTGITLRPFVESVSWKNKKVVRQSAEWLANQLFEADCYDNQPGRDSWTELHYPFWTTDILSVLDLLSRLNFSTEHPKISQALDCLLKKQNPQGFWECSNQGASFEDHLWVTLSVLRIFKRFSLVKT